MRFMLDGCDISFIAEAPEDITLKQLLKQTDKIVPHYCACGIRSLHKDEEDMDIDIRITYDSIEKTDDDVSCWIVDNEVEE